jgi:SPP1 family predicted phage head-tail adaptor
MSLKAGSLRHRITIYYPDREQNPTTGEMETTWIDFATIWAKWEPYSTKDFLAAAAIQNETSVRAIVRQRDDITASMRVYFRSKYYEIVGPPLPDTNSGLEYMTLMLAEVIND